MEIIKITKDIRFVNVGENPTNPKSGTNWIGRRQWDACVEYGFISAGQGIIYNKPLLNLKIDDIVAAFLTGRGYVGIGIVTEEAKKIMNFRYNGKPLLGLPYIKDSLFENSSNEKTEFAVRVKWIKTVDRRDAFWRSNFGLFANRSIQCNLGNQTKTIKYLEDCFKLKFV